MSQGTDTLDAVVVAACIIVVGIGTVLSVRGYRESMHIFNQFSRNKDEIFKRQRTSGHRHRQS